MEDQFNINQALRVYDKVVTHGIKRGDKSYFQDISAWSDFDGYTIQLSYEQVTLSIYFHNKYEFEYGHSKSLDLFLKKLATVDQLV